MKKPSDLKIPTYDMRQPFITEGFFVVPKNYDSHGSWQMPSFESTEIFNNSNPVNIEYCSGNGQWILEKALKNPHLNWIACEKRFDRSRKIWVKMHNMGLKNLFIVFGDGFTFSKYYLQENSIAKVFVNFPDPWPKNKHIKNRLVNLPFIQELTRAVILKGSATFVTDSDIATNWIISTLLKNKEWVSLYEKPYFISDYPDYGDSYFKDLWIKKGLQIKYIEFLNGKTIS